MPDQELAVQEEGLNLETNRGPVPVEAQEVPDRTSVRVLDFRQPNLLTPGQMRKLRARHEDFVRSLATRLSIYFRLEFGLKILDIQTPLFPRFIQMLPAATHMAMFKVPTLTGTGLVEFSPRFSLALLDRMLGGTGTVLDLGRELSDLEVAVLDHAIRLILNEWLPGILQLPQNQVDFVGHEINPRFLQVAGDDVPMLTLSLEAQMGGSTDTIRIACPFPMVASILGQLEPVSEAVKTPRAAIIHPPLKWNSRLDEINVPLTAAWSGLQIKAETLAHLKPGDTLPLSPDLFNKVQVRLAKITKFVGSLGQANERWAIELNAPATTHV
ncbi:MAG: flagellar motor switch protein FliM [Verrucomicrobiales bacterium]|nr:flagellar motor switch protein FliM [Verrucomicrobiales bacterium]